MGVAARLQVDDRQARLPTDPPIAVAAIAIDGERSKT
jgi:hypothetical protein